MSNQSEIKKYVENFLNDWDRVHWIHSNGEEWASEDDSSIAPDQDYICDDVIDPDGIKDDAIPLGVGDSWEGWDCREGWAAYRAGDALYVNWWRKAWGNRHARDLWVKVCDEFFEGEDQLENEA